LKLWILLLLAFVQGILEWLPVSSEGQMVVIISAFTDESLDSAISLSIWLHVGTMLAVIIKYHYHWIPIIRGSTEEYRALRKFLFWTTLATGVVGFPVMLLLSHISPMIGQIVTLLIGVALIITAGAFLGVLVFGFGGWTWGLMFALFFIIGSGATFIGKEKKQKHEAGWEKGDTARDSLQVISKGFWGMVCALLYVIWPSYSLMVAYMASMSTSLADTLGSEIGVLSPWRPRKITRLWKAVPHGTSGAVSLIGELVTLAGGLIIGGLAFFVVPLEKDYTTHQMLWMIIIVILASFIAANLDSLMSATVQKMYSCEVCGKEVEGEEHCGEKAIRLRGIGWINNDRVNMLAVLSSVIIGLGLSFLI